ncbi:MAG: MFS transporter [Desulfobacteraceae bacterium]|nr:MFS transporter [Desulfobacteraceae bacterium]
MSTERCADEVRKEGTGVPQGEPCPECHDRASYRALLLISCVVCFGCYSGAYMRIPVLPLFARALGADTVLIGLITSSFMFCAGLLCLPLGILSDRLGRKRLILSGLLVMAAASVLIGFCRAPWQIMVFHGLSGAGIAAFAPTMMSFVTDISPRTHLGRSYGWYTMALYGGMSLGPALGGFAAQFLSFQWVFTISGAAAFAMFWVVLFRLPRRNRLHAHPQAQRPGRIIMRELLGNRPLLACWLVTLMSCFGLGVFVTFVSLHASDNGVGVGEIGLIFGTQAMVNALCRIPFGHLSDRVSDRSRLVLAGLLGYSLSIAGIGYSTSLPSFLASAFAMGISMGVAFTAVGALIAEVVPHDSRGLAMGGYNTCIYIGMMLSGLIMGFVNREAGFSVGFLITAIVNAAGAFAFSLIFRNVRAERSVLEGN